MPLYEYACKDCEKEFELLMRASDTPECPSCHSTVLERRMSTFAARTNGGTTTGASAAPSMGGCGACGDPRGPGACSMN